MNALPGVSTLTAMVTSSSIDDPEVPQTDPCSGDPVQQGGHDEGKKIVIGQDGFDLPKKVALPGLFGSGSYY